MGASAVAVRLGEVAATMPRAPFFVPPAGNSDDPEAEFDRALKTYRKSIMIWRSGMLAYVPKIDGIFSEMERDSSPEVMKLAVDFLMEKIKVAMDDSLAHAQQQVDMPPEIREKLDYVSRISSQGRKIAKSIEKKWTRAAIDYRNMLLDLQDRLKVVEWDHDPDTRARTGSFSTPGDVDAFFADIAAQ